DDSGISIGKFRSATYQESGMFSFFQVYRAGHFVPTDQPEAALLMINDFIHGIFGPDSPRATPVGALGGS
ncbi:hypothetical protein Pmar_PMAR003810, partial [Perkinsus marinus ATCC 50983]